VLTRIGPWVLLYIERWLKVPVRMGDGSIVPRTAWAPQGGVISPLLANLFLQYAFDMWMAREFPHIPFERYADDAICHCKSAEEARALWSALADRFAACKLVLHPEKTKIVYCKDVIRRQVFPVISFEFLGFLSDARAFKHALKLLSTMTSAGYCCNTLAVGNIAGIGWLLPDSFRDNELPGLVRDGDYALLLVWWLVTLTGLSPYALTGWFSAPLKLFTELSSMCAKRVGIQQAE
jgi:Reverse transcriptase (RNA-dependent DNA polymerase)